MEVLLKKLQIMVTRLLATECGHFDLVKWLFSETTISLQSMNRNGTCIIQAALDNNIEMVVWMLNNGSLLDENTKLDIHGNTVNCLSCANILKQNGVYEDVKRVFTKKSFRK